MTLSENKECSAGRNWMYIFNRRNAKKVNFGFLAQNCAMPTIIIEGYRFRFYSSDGNEPPHVHVLRAEREAKIWLQPVEVEYNRNYNRVELTRILKLTQQHQERLLEVWHAYFNQ